MNKVKFKCPDCGKETNLIQVCTGILFIKVDAEDNGNIEGLLQDWSQGETIRFECDNCKKVIKDKQLNVMKAEKDLIAHLYKYKMIENPEIKAITNYLKLNLSENNKRGLDRLIELIRKENC